MYVLAFSVEALANVREQAIGLVDVLVGDDSDSTIYHIEARPSEAGRNVLVNTLTGKDIVGPEYDVRTAVHEYGGAPAIVSNGVVYFSNVVDNRVYRVEKGNDPEPITPGMFTFFLLESASDADW